HLGGEIRRSIAPSNSALRSIRKRYRWIEVPTRDWPEGENQGCQCGSVATLQERFDKLGRYGSRTLSRRSVQMAPIRTGNDTTGSGLVLAFSHCRTETSRNSLPSADFRST